MSEPTFDAVPWQIRMERLTERLAKLCTGCLFKGARCDGCDCAMAVGIIRDRDASGNGQTATDGQKLKPSQRRMQVAGNMARRGWLKPADILWPCKTPPNVRTMDLECLAKAGVVERRQPDPDNCRVFQYRRVEA